jgi:SPW repeat
MVMKRLQESANLLLGGWMMMSPWILGFADDRRLFTSMPMVAVWTAVCLGAAIVLCAALSMFRPKVWEEALTIVFGLCLVAAPWALGFSAQSMPTANSVLVGLVVTALAVWATMKKSDVQHWLHEHHWAR